jgi:hypothetical protein
LNGNETKINKMEKSTIFECTKSLVMILSTILLVFAVTGLFWSAIISQQILRIYRFYLSSHSILLILEVIVAFLVLRFENFYFKLVYCLIAIVSLILKFISPIDAIIGAKVTLFFTFVEMVLILLVLNSKNVKYNTNYYEC